MILADTSKWIDHLRRPDKYFDALLIEGFVDVHPFVIGELAMGSIQNRETFLNFLSYQPSAKLAQHDEVLSFITTRALFRRGLSYVDAHLLVSVQLTPGSRLWTLDKKLRHAAEELDLAFTN